MKKVLYVLTVITALCVALFCITSCAEHSADSSFENPSSEIVESESDMQKIYKVTFDNVAQSVTVKNGERVEPLDADYNGREFLGWANAEGEIWDFSKPITEDLTSKLNAVNLVKEASLILGGKGGGGRADMAQAGGPDFTKAKEALLKIEDIIKKA